MLYVARSTTASRGNSNNNIYAILYTYILSFKIINKQYSLLPMEKYLSKYETVKALNKKLGTKRRYKEDYIGYGFVSSEPEKDPLPFCLICNSALSNEPLVPSKLKRHLETKRSAVKEQPKKYFENIMAQQNKQPKKFTNYL